MTARRFRLMPTQSIEYDGCHVPAVRNQANVPFPVDFTAINRRRIRSCERKVTF